LDEFRNTPSSELTIEDFQNIWLEETCDPPSFSNARKKGKRKRSIDSEYEKDYETEELKKEINDILKGDEIKELTGKINSKFNFYHMNFKIEHLILTILKLYDNYNLFIYKYYIYSG